MLFGLAAFAFALPTCTAVFADEAWNLDWHYALLGEPQETTTFFHRPNAASKASLVYTLSEQHVLGALNPKDGSVVWRQKLTSSTSTSNDTFFRAADGSDIVVNGFDDLVSGRSAADGKLAWTFKASGPLKDVEIYDFGEHKDAVVLSGQSSAVVERLDEATGAVKWRYQAETSDTPFQISVASTAVYVVLLHKTMLGYIKIKVIALDPVDGKKRDEYTLSSENELATADNILTVGANSASPIIAWTDASHSTIKVNVLGSKAISSFSIKSASGESVQSVRLHAPFHANSLSHFLVHYATAADNWAEVFHIDLKSAKIDKAYKLPSYKDQSTFSTSSIDANVYFTRTSANEVAVFSSASHGVLGKWQLTNSLSAIERRSALPEFAITEISLKDNKVSAYRSAVWLTSGELVLLRDTQRIWERPEALADTVDAWFMLPEAAGKLGSALSTPVSKNPITSFVKRLSLHLFSLNKSFGGPAMFDFIPQLFLDAPSATATAFGFDKTVICRTGKGKTYSLDMSKAGRIQFSCPPSTNGSTIDVLSSSLSTGLQVDFHKTGDHLEAYVSGDASREPIWTFLPKSGDKIIDIVPRPADDPVASIGIVLGNRKVLYKYLNANIALILTINEAAATLSTNIIDTVSGDLLFSNVHSGVDLSLPIAAVLVESWFAYSFTVESSSSSPKGTQLVSGELYESLSADDRGLLDANTNHSSLASNVLPFVLTQVYHIAEPISKLTVTRTRQSITTRQLLAVLPESDSIVGIPRAAIDPRRPNRDPTNDEKMEGLVKYTPNLDLDPKWYLNHKRELLGIKDVIASPALLESTSVIFAYGHDIFGTRVSPSFNFDMLGRDFNKFQMLATVFALAIATVLVAPLVTRKQVNARWSLYS